LSGARIANIGRTITVDIHTVTASGIRMKLLTRTISVVLESGETMMPDSEKVIKGLEVCTAIGGNCDGCINNDVQREYEAAIDMLEYCERCEQTYNQEDGSM
jgi:hypothetical protein